MNILFFLLLNLKFILFISSYDKVIINNTDRITTIYHSQKKQNSFSLNNSLTEFDLIQRGLFLDNYYSIDRSLNNNNSKKIRKLSSMTTLNNVGFINLEKNKNINSVYKYIFENLKIYRSNFILYPYAFNYTDSSLLEDNLIKKESGGIFTLDPKSLTSSFDNIKDITTVEIGQSKALYDINIGILSIQSKLNNLNQNLFSEADLYCSYFIQKTNKVKNCLTDLDQFKSYKETNPSKGAVVYINEDMLFNDILNEENNFGLLIIPDHIFGTENLIMNKLNTSCVEKIKNFIKNGGNILTSGKSGFLLEKMNIIENGSYDNKKILTKVSNDNSFLIDVYGCDGTKNVTNAQQENFIKQVLCLNYPQKTSITSTYIMEKYDKDFEVLMYVNLTDSNLKLRDSNGDETNIDLNKNNNFPFLLTKEYVNKDNNDNNNLKGRIFIINSNIMTNSNYASTIFNIILYSMSKNIIINSKIVFEQPSKTTSTETESEEEEEDINNEDIPIPGGESDILLQSQITLYNLFNYNIKDISIDIFIPDQVSFIEYNSNCQISSDNTYYNSTLIPNMNLNSYLHCSIENLDKFSVFELKTKIKILDSTVTQKQTAVELIYPFIKYFDTNLNKNLIINYRAFTVECKRAAVLRATFNPDPAGTYPVWGRGYYSDAVLNVENKENTYAKNVSFISIVPLISPVTDGSDQTQVAQAIYLYKNYYHSHKYTFPWTSTGGNEYDYIDNDELNGKGLVYVKDWDTAVRISKISRDEVKHNISSEGIENEIYDPLNFQDGSKLDILGANIITSTNSENLLLQIAFTDSELFYEHATQRTMVFVDTSTEKGAESQYGFIDTELNLDTSNRNPDNVKTEKIELFFSRNDIFFYENENYQLPKGMNLNYVLSVDNYEIDVNENKVETFGQSKSKIYKNGEYNSNNINNDREPLIANEYTNPLLYYKNMKRLNPTNETDMNEIKSLSDDTIRLTHYLCKITQTNLNRAGNIKYFKENDDKITGYYEKYPSLKFIYAHKIELPLDPKITRQGGRVTIKLDSYTFKDNKDPIENEYITTSADNVAFYKTEYDSASNSIQLYFKRGLMPNENYGLVSKCEIYIENLNMSEIENKNITLSIKLEELNYDLSAYDTNYERFTPQEYSSQLEAKYSPFFSYPALKIENHFTRKNSNTNKISHSIKEYELLNPYSRYGIYLQELYGHRTIYGRDEAHHIIDPGVQAINSGFMKISVVGISFIPFAEFVSHGSHLLIPGAIETTRIEWTDIWGRRWHQPIRSLFVDYPPIPAPLYNFMMSTTFEIISGKDEKTQLLEWYSDEKAYIRVQMKFTNTYFKWFSPSICKNNRVAYLMEEQIHGERDRIFDMDSVNYNINERNDITDEHYVSFGHSSIYGNCYTSSGSYLSGKEITDDIKDSMNKAMTCANTNDANEIKQCAIKLKELGLPLLKRRNNKDDEDNSPSKTYNYGPDIDKYFPKDFIETSMWDLTKRDYVDNNMDKGYNYYLDDGLPSLDPGPPQFPAYKKPHNFVAFPIYKGLGYKIDYDRNLNIKKFAKYKGWWSDNLQNKDNTLVAGQEKINKYSVNQNDLLNDDDWIDAFDLKGNDELIKYRLKNFYVCLFNRKRIKINPKQQRFAYPRNVYYNYVVPVFPDLLEEDERYTNFDCSRETPFYGRENISEIDNRVYTSTDRDWLYFTLGLRGEAKENINVLLTLNPYDDRKFEGITKVQDGGRFTYWNPPLGPNAYYYVDNVVNTIISYRVDLSYDQSLYPLSFTTFNSVGYLYQKIYDKNEELREYTMTTYTNSYGFGDSTITVYVGGTEDTNCKVYPNQKTYVKITFYNNCGFDWNLLYNGIEFEYKGEKTLNANDFLYSITHSIQKPLKYNFMEVEVPEEIKNYITIEPSDHNIEVAPQFFDFQSINVVTIKDGFEGSYFYKITIKEDFPEKYKGRLWDIKLNLKEEYFDMLPGYNDNIVKHDYKLKIPNIKFGVPYGKNSKYEGKVFYTLGRAKNINLNYKLFRDFTPVEVKIIPEENLNLLSECVAENDKINTKLAEFYETKTKLLSNKINIEINSIEGDSNFNLISYDLSQNYPLLPYEIYGSPDITSIYLITKLQSDQLEFSSSLKTYVKNAKISYNDGNKNKKESYDNYSQGNSKGAWITLSNNGFLVSLNESDGTYYKSLDQTIYSNDEGIINVNLTLLNSGSDTAFSIDLNLEINNNVEFIEELYDTSIANYSSLDSNNGKKNLTFHNFTLDNNVKKNFKMYFKFKINNENNNNKLRNLNELNIIDNCQLSLCQTKECSSSSKSNSRVLQKIKNFALFYKIVENLRPNIKLSIESLGNFTNPKYYLKTELEGLENKENKYIYEFYYKIPTYNLIEETFIENNNNGFVNHIPFVMGENEFIEVDKYDIEYIVKIYDAENNNKFIDSDSIIINEIKNINNSDIENKKKFKWWITLIIVIGALLIILLGIYLFYLIKKKKFFSNEKFEIKSEISNDNKINNNNNNNNDNKNSVISKQTNNLYLNINNNDKSNRSFMKSGSYDISRFQTDKNNSKK